MVKDILVLFSTLVIGCSFKVGESETSKEDQATAFFSEKINTPARTECNKRGKFYSTTNDRCYDDINIATWVCSSGEISKQLSQRRPESAYPSLEGEKMSLINQRLASGYTLLQCGVDAIGTIYFTMIKKSTSGDGMNLEIFDDSIDTANVGPQSAPQNSGGTFNPYVNPSTP